MLAVTTKVLPAARNFSRQIVPPVVATLIAALLIAGFNRAFSGHLVQPRMAAMRDNTGQGTRPIVYAANPHEAVAVTEIDPLAAPAIRERVFAKDAGHEAGKDQAALRVATAPAVPAAPRVIARRSEPTEGRPAEPQRVASVPVVVSAPVAAPAMTAPVTVQPTGPVTQQPIAPIAAQPIAPPAQPMAPQPMPQPPMAQQPIGGPIGQEPPPVIMAKPMVTVPDRPRPAYPSQAYPNQAYPNQAYPNQAYANQAHPNQGYPGQTYPNQSYPNYDPRQPYGQQQAQADEDYARPREPRPLERFVDAIKPSSIFNRMREFGDRIEAAGNEILPNIRQ